MFPPGQGASIETALDWLFRPHNQHWIVPTRAKFLLFYHLNGWNLATQQYFNFLIYGTLLLSVAWSLAVATAVEHQGKGIKQALAVPAPFLVFLLSPIPYENHDWAFQSQFHFALLFAWWGCFFLVSQGGGFRKRTAGTLMLILAILSQSIGAAAALTAVGLFVMSRVVGWKAYSGSRGRALLPIAPVVLAVLATAFLWRRSVARIIPESNVIGPFDSEFWSFLFNLISFGWGINSPSWESGLILLMISAAPVAYLVYRAPSSGQSWLLLSWCGMVLGTLAAIALGRADRGLTWTKAARYAEVTLLLIPPVMIAWGQLFRDSSRQKLALMLGWLLVAVLFANNWNFGIYQARHLIRKQGIECLNSQLERGEEDVYCPHLFPRPLGPRLDQAKALNLSFVDRWLMSSSASSPEPVVGD